MSLTKSLILIISNSDPYSLIRINIIQNNLIELEQKNKVFRIELVLFGKEEDSSESIFFNTSNWYSVNYLNSISNVKSYLISNSKPYNHVINTCPQFYALIVSIFIKSDYKSTFKKKILLPFYNKMIAVSRKKETPYQLFSESGLFVKIILGDNIIVNFDPILNWNFNKEKGSYNVFNWIFDTSNKFKIESTNFILLYFNTNFWNKKLYSRLAIAIINKITSLYNIKIILIFKTKEKLLMEQIKLKINSTNRNQLILSFSEMIDIEDLFSLVKNAKLFVSNNTYGLTLISFLKIKIFPIKINTFPTALFKYIFSNSRISNKIEIKVEKINYLIKQILKA